MTAGLVATYLARADLAARLQVQGSVAANVKVFLQEAAKYGSDADPSIGTLDHIASMNYIPCTDTATSKKRSEPNSSLLVRDDGPIGAESFSSTPIRRLGMLLTTAAGVSLSNCTTYCWAFTDLQNYCSRLCV